MNSRTAAFLIRIHKLLVILLVLGALLASCSDPVIEQKTPEAFTVSVLVDGSSRELEVDGGTVRNVLEDLALSLGEADIIEPPLFTPVTSDLSVTVKRVSESLEIIEQTVPFQRRSVRNESMNVDDPPLIIQAGNHGIQEITVRIVYHDGLEFSRQETQVNIIETPQDEIVMVGVGAAPRNIDFNGVLAFIEEGNSVIFRGSTAFPEQLNTGGELDHRVYQLSPSGHHLLFTKSSIDEDIFNSLWVVSTEREADPLPLGINNVLWAGWNPSRVGQPQIAYSTGASTQLLPGWEANNDLWIGDIPLEEAELFDPERVIDTYPATYGWWGGNYAWAPDGNYIAYAFADEVGIIEIVSSAEEDLEPDSEVEEETIFHSKLKDFTEYNTRGDWVWVPALSWSPDSQFIVFSQHSGDDPDEPIFDTWVHNIADNSQGLFVNHSGIWSYPYWSPLKPDLFNPNELASQIAYLRAAESADSRQSSYTLWLMDRDGSNTQQIYPPVGENSKFSQDKNFMSWGPLGENVAFIFDEQLWILNIESLEARTVSQEDSIASSPTWAPYGLGAAVHLSDSEPFTFSTTPTVDPSTNNDEGGPP